MASGRVDFDVLGPGTDGEPEEEEHGKRLEGAAALPLKIFSCDAPDAVLTAAVKAARLALSAAARGEISSQFE